MTIPSYYRRPLLIALLVHVLLICLLIFNFAPTLFRAPPASAPVQLIHAKAIIESSSPVTTPPPTVVKPVKVEPPTPKPIEKPAKPVEAKPKPVIEKKLIDEKILTAKADAEKKAMAAKAQVKAEALKKKMEAKAEAQKKLMEEKALLAKRAQERKAAIALKLKNEQKKLQQQLMQQQILSEEKNISTVVSQAQRGEIDKYKAEILAAIQSNWRIDKVDDKLKCVYSVSIAPDGTVLSEKLIKSSGSDNLDESAKQAIIASSPLPVPTNPTLFNHFRQLILTLSPQGYVNNA